jgi:hypothetical protein
VLPGPPSPWAARAASALALTHRQIILEDPVALTFTRTTRLPLEGAYLLDRTEHGPYTVRLYQEGVRAPVLDTLPAERRDQTEWALAAGTEADLCGDPDAWDETTIPDVGLARIVAVFPLRHGGAVFGYRARLELVRPADADAFPNPLVPPPAAPPAAPGGTARLPWSAN